MRIGPGIVCIVNVMSRPRVVITEPLDPAAVAWLAERCDVFQPPAVDDAAIADALSQADALIVRTYTRVDAALLDRAPRLRVVGRAGVGLDNIDTKACEARGIAVLHTPDANTRAVTEFVWSLIFSVVRPLEPIRRALSEQDWRALRDSNQAPRELAGMTLGVLGLGRIGRSVARAGATLMGRVIYHDIREIAPVERAGAEPVGFEELLADSDVLTIHVDGRASNRGLIGADACDLLKRDLIFINASRGIVVDRPALASFLRRNSAAVALLDVHDPEPIPADDPLLSNANARLYPHLAAATVPAKRAMSGVVEAVWLTLTETAPRNSRGC